MVKRSVKVVPTSKEREKPISVGTARQEKEVLKTEGALDPSLAKQNFSSEQQAIQFFTESIASKIEEDPAQRADLQEFLQLLLETDPILREELLEGLNVKK
jgi:hypothetical protein